MTIPTVSNTAKKAQANYHCLLLLAFATVCFQSGCVSGRRMFAGRPRDPMAGAPQLHNHRNPPLEEVVAHLNHNTDKIKSWRADNVKIQTNGWSLSGKLAVEKESRIRLVVSSPLGNEVDLGSNDERFWVWSRRPEPTFLTCKHENMEVARQKMGIPFEPEWLMQALSISRLPVAEVKMEAAPTLEQARLVQEVVSAHGIPFRRVVLVDLKRGIVVEHSLYDYNSVRIAVAKLSGHRHDKATGVVLPHRVMLELPQNQMSMTMDLGKIQINPQSIPTQIWDMPEMPRCEVVNLDEGLDRTRIATRPGSAVRIGSIEPASSDEYETPTDGLQKYETLGEQAGHARLSNLPINSKSSTLPDEDWDK